MENCKHELGNGAIVVAGIEKKSGYRWLVNWVTLLATVFLFASSLNCLFLWLAYGNGHDAAGLAFSLILALFVYFRVFNSKKIASLPTRLLLAVTSLLLWAIFMPIILHFTGLR